MAGCGDPSSPPSGKNYRVVAPDLPGFGPRPDSRASHLTLAQAVAERCDAHAIVDAHLVGLSLGGAVAIDFALAFPERVRSLTLVDAFLRGRPSGIAAGDACSLHAKAGRMQEAAAAWLSDPLFATARKRPSVFARLEEMAADYDGGHWSGRSSTRFAIEDPAARLGTITVPTLVVIGREDLASFRAMAEEYAAKIPRARKVVLDAVGHMANLEAPDAFNAALGEFLAAID
jgi:pimeloyl-ACP methyl ester carboxylesterase